MAIDITKLTLTTVTTVADLMNWSEQFMQPGASGTPRMWAFRGQSREFQTLVPSFQRLFSGNTHAAAELIEKELMNAFRKHYAVLHDAEASKVISVGNGRGLCHSFCHGEVQ